MSLNDNLVRAEVNGMVGALIDGGLVKVASAEDAEVVAETIAQNLPADYDIGDALKIASDVVDSMEDEGDEDLYEDEDGYIMDSEGNYLEEDDDDYDDDDDYGYEKEAEERDVMAYVGELSLAKEAGDISEEEYAEELEKVANKFTDMATRAGGAIKKGWNAMTAKGGEVGAKVFKGGAERNAAKAKDAAAEIVSKAKDAAKPTWGERATRYGELMSRSKMQGLTGAEKATELAKSRLAQGLTGAAALGATGVAGMGAGAMLRGNGRPKYASDNEMMAYIGELSLAKEAGDISEYEYADELEKIAKGGKILKKIKDMGGRYKELMKGGNPHKSFRFTTKNMIKNEKRKALAARLGTGVAGAGVLGAGGYGASKLAEDEEEQEIMAYVGELSLAKEAGDISDYEYEDEMEKIAKGMKSIKAGYSRGVQLLKGGKRKFLKKSKKTEARKVLAARLGAGAVGAGVLGAGGYGAYKLAEDEEEQEIMAYVGELSLAKEAGDISEYEYADELEKIAKGGKILKKIKAMGGRYKELMKGGNPHKSFRFTTKNMIKNEKRRALAARLGTGVAGAGVLGAGGYGASKLAEDEEEQEIMAYVGELSLAKEAGDISDYEYEDEMEKIAKKLTLAGKVTKAGKRYMKLLRGGNSHFRKRSKAKEARKVLATRLGTGAVGVGALGGAGYAGSKLAEDEEEQEIMAYVGELSLAKEAGDISDYEYEDEMEKIAKKLNMAQNAWNRGKELLGGGARRWGKKKKAIEARKVLGARVAAAGTGLAAAGGIGYATARR